MADVRWVDRHIEVDPPKHPKKITGTRFATLLGLNPWSTPFQIWCEVTKTYQLPFEDTIYTIAGKTIEPKQAQYMVDSYGMDNLKTPTDIYGDGYFKTTYGDFFHDQPILGGMWDYLLYEDGVPTTVLEMKTSKRVEDWGSDIPEYYALQAALYAYLLGVDEVIMVASFLSPADYEHPEQFKPSVANTVTRVFKVSERYPDFEERVKRVLSWWDQYIKTGVSPDYDEKLDAEYLQALRTRSVSPDTDIAELLADAEALKQKVDAAKAAIAKDEKALKQATDLIKRYAIERFKPGDTKVTLPGAGCNWEVSMSTSTRIDEDALAADGLLEKYKSKPTTTYRIAVKNKED